MSLENVIETDVLVIGGGVAGCFAAIKAREQGLDVTIVDKAYTGKSGNSILGYCYWQVFNSEWGHHLDAAMDAGHLMLDYLSNREWSEIVIKDSWGTYQDLVSWGVEFPVESDKRKDYFTVAHPNPRSFVSRTPSGLSAMIPLRHGKVTPVLRKQAKKVGVKIMDRIMVTDLLKQDGGVVGAVGFPMETYDLYVFKAKATVSAAGGSGLKPPGHLNNSVTGDAEAMAYRAGAEMGGKEFSDPHWGLANYPAWKSNAELYPVYWDHTDAEGNYIGYGSLPHTVHAGNGPVIWDFDLATPEDIKSMQESTWRRGNPIELERIGFDPSRGGKYQVIGGVAAGRSFEQTGGIWPINTKCAASLPGLYAAGDCCCTWCAWFGGLSPSAVTGKRAGAGAAEYALQMKKPKIDKEELARLKKIMFEPTERKGGFSPRWVTQLLQNTMMPYFILYIKHGERLQAALTIVEFIRDHLVPKLTAKDAHELRLAHETKNMLLNAEVQLRSSLFRTESRMVLGFNGHYREDYPRRDDPTWLAWVKLKGEQGRMKVSKEPVPKKWWPDLLKPYKERYPFRIPGESVD